MGNFKKKLKKQAKKKKAEGLPKLRRNAESVARKVGDVKASTRNQKKRTKRKSRSDEKQSLLSPEAPVTNTKPSSVKNDCNEKLKKLKVAIKKDSPLIRGVKTGRRNNGLSLRERMLERLTSARFRYINEQIYSMEGADARKMFQDDPEAFGVYHSGYRRQCKSWPLNPLDVVIQSLNKMPKDLVVADFGCGEARMAATAKQTRVHSFDLVAVNETVTACDMKNVPLENCTVDVAVFCLSLMGTNLHDYLKEANRVLKTGGLLKIAEVESRFEDVAGFVKAVECFGFKLTWKDLSHDLFYFMDFKKERNVGKKKTPAVSLNPCLYKRR